MGSTVASKENKHDEAIRKVKKKVLTKKMVSAGKRKKSNPAQIKTSNCKQEDQEEDNKEQNRQTCQICNKTYSGKSRKYVKDHLRRHILRSHVPRIRRYYCSICNTRYIDLEAVRMHYKQLHPGLEVSLNAQELVCNYEDCIFSTFSFQMMRDHTITQHYKGDVDEAIRKTGRGAGINYLPDREYNCAICDYGSSESRCVFLHLEKIHGISLNRNVLIDRKQGVDKDWEKSRRRYHATETSNLIIKKGLEPTVIDCRYPGCDQRIGGVWKFREHVFTHDDVKQAVEKERLHRQKVLTDGGIKCGLSECRFVGHRKKDNTAIYIHRRKHQNDGFQCLICGDIFRPQCNAFQHVREHHDIHHNTQGLFTKVNTLSEKVIQDDSIQSESEEDVIGQQSTETFKNLNTGPVPTKRRKQYKNLKKDALEAHREHFSEESRNKSASVNPNSEDSGGVNQILRCGKNDCDYWTQLDEDMKNHKNRHLKGYNFKCIICSQICKSRSCIQTHVQDVHKLFDQLQHYVKLTNVNDGVTQMSNKQILGLGYKLMNVNSKFRSKLLRNILPRPHRCGQCKTNFETMELLATHKEEIHPEAITIRKLDEYLNTSPILLFAKSEIKCEHVKCNAVMETEEEYRKHAFTHATPTKLVTALCDQKNDINLPYRRCPQSKCEYFTSRDDMENHVYRHHNGFNWQCLFCFQLFPLSRAAARHVYSFHDVKKNVFAFIKKIDDGLAKLNLKCTLGPCEFATESMFAWKDHVIHHMITDEQKYACELCGVRMKDGVKLHLHYKFVHPFSTYAIKNANEEDASHTLVCNSCEETFSTVQLHLAHFKVFHKDEVNDVKKALFPYVFNKNSVFFADYVIDNEKESKVEQAKVDAS